MVCGVNDFSVNGPEPIGFFTVSLVGSAKVDHWCLGTTNWLRILVWFTNCELGKVSVTWFPLEEMSWYGMALVFSPAFCLEQGEGVRHVLGGERLAVRPLDVVADGEGELLEVVRPLPLRGQPCLALVSGAGLVGHHQGLVDHVAVAQRGAGRGAQERVVVLGLGAVGHPDVQHGRGVLAATGLAGAATGDGAEGQHTGKRDHDGAFDAHFSPLVFSWFPAGRRETEWVSRWVRAWFIRAGPVRSHPAGVMEPVGWRRRERGA